MSKKIVHLAYLYPHEMNTYGDWGNVLCLKKRLEWRGYKVEVIEHRPGQALPKQVDLLFMGGGQDSGQIVIETDFKKLAPWLKRLVADGVPMLTICGAYQLFGHSFQMADGKDLPGVGIFDVHTKAQPGRLIGNLQIDSDSFGQLVGFENHSGRTYLGSSAQPLGHVVLGAGNNNEDKTEGVMYQRAIGTYLHGPVLPKNPQLADWLIAAAVGTSNTKLEPLPDQLVDSARAAAAARPR